MDWPIGVALLFALLFAGIPIAFAMTAVSFFRNWSQIAVGPALAVIGQVYFDRGRPY